MPVRLAMLGVLSLAVLASCGPSEARPLVIVANAHQAGTLAVGEQRVLIGLVEAEGNRFLADPALEVTVDFFFGDDPSQVAGTVVGEFLWTVPEVRGLYRTTFSFDRPGTWGVVVRADGLPGSEVTLFSVVPDSPVPAVGDPAPRVVTPAASERPLAEISSDPAPDPRFYELSLDAALASGRKTVVVFATPRFCATATCGPVLDLVKGIAPRFPDVNFVHVEVYENLDPADGEDLVLVPAVVDWRLPSEPWVFVVDGTGTVAAAFEGTVAPEELQAALTD
jgi:hypothetical protein